MCHTEHGIAQQIFESRAIFCRCCGHDIMGIAIGTCSAEPTSVGAAYASRNADRWDRYYGQSSPGIAFGRIPLRFILLYITRICAFPIPNCVTQFNSVYRDVTIIKVCIFRPTLIASELRASGTYGNCAHFIYIYIYVAKLIVNKFVQHAQLVAVYETRADTRNTRSLCIYLCSAH